MYIAPKSTHKSKVHYAPETARDTGTVTLHAQLLSHIREHAEFLKHR